MKRTAFADSPPLIFARNKDATAPDFSLENQCSLLGYERIAGIDEAGRGPLAGPVVCACVMLDKANTPDGLNDSKKLSHAKRQILFDQILETARVSISVISNHTIDEVNIRQATLLGMNRAAHSMHHQKMEDGVQWYLVDGRDVPPALKGNASAVIGGDAQSLSIAAASIVAKVARDRIMIRLDLTYPEYKFAAHKGYGTKVHLEALSRYGPCPAHRFSFAPIRER